MVQERKKGKKNERMETQFLPRAIVNCVIGFGPFHSAIKSSAAFFSFIYLFIYLLLTRKYFGHNGPKTLERLEHANTQFDATAVDHRSGDGGLSVNTRRAVLNDWGVPTQFPARSLDGSRRPPNR